jgi:hypothetical protein
VAPANLHGTAQKYFHLPKLETVVDRFDCVEKTIASFAPDCAQHPCH